MILLRHGQSEFNLHFSATRRDPGIKDPKLTILGRHQAEQAAEALAGEDIRRIIASPYTRALETAAPLARRLGLPVLVHPLVRERYAFTCDIGSPCAALAMQWPELDFSHIDEVWWPATEEPAGRWRTAPACSAPRWARWRTGRTPSSSAIGGSSCR
ncbi:histidine phosphatase family protein [Teichococcus aestuarii]|uniref:histidine phosphatase family protein n=1 Tax=Teichococcus aestuarii TaxID=568898 RepID=UPI0036089980